ncbi:MAG TPA: tetratricopeptide repeat protein, partial [Thermopetrobacter sp.]|nr:tetratricopeptide repeat protein [Thermopetrobacter sp.]
GLPPAVNPDDLRRDPDLFAGAGPRMSARIERPAGSAAGRGGGERLLGRLRVDERGRPLPSDTAAPRAPATPGAARPLPGVPTRLRATPPADTANGAAPLVPERVEAVPLPAPETKMARADADGLLERARNDFLARRYDRAAAAYRDFLQRAQGHPARADATFELGETYYLQGRYREAGKAYLDTYRKFPASRVASQALFKLGMSLKRLGQKKQACRTWKLLRDRYAASRPARLLAPREMKRAGCRG